MTGYGRNGNDNVNGGNGNNSITEAHEMISCRATQEIT